MAQKEGSAMLTISAEIEAEISELDDPDDRQLFLEDLGLETPGVNRLIKDSYRHLNLITFFTIGDEEVRAWTVKQGTLAPEAAGQVHTDFQEGFIKAEVIKFEDFKELKSTQACKEAGKVHLEGKDYEVEDGDIIYFRTQS
jgi:ribosome-binding ATPase YchF (GTP1/OBG family)